MGETRRLGGGGRGPKRAIFALGRARRANATAINAGGFDAHIEAAVKTLVLGDAGGVAGVGIKVHGRNMGAGGADVSPDSDMHPRGPTAAALSKNQESGMKLRWLIVAGAGILVLAAWSAVAITYLFFHPTLAVWTGVVTAAALSLEGFFWVCAGALGWSFLAGRRQMLARLRHRFLAQRQD